MVADASGHVLRAEDVEIFQINLGKLCNMTCRHCHVDAGPDRWQEVMDRSTVEACLEAIDLTGDVTALHLAIDRGINFLDTAAGYGDGVVLRGGIRCGGCQGT